MTGMYLNKVCMVLISFSVPHRDYDSLNSPFENKKSKRKQNETNQNKNEKKKSKKSKENKTFLSLALNAYISATAAKPDYHKFQWSGVKICGILAKDQAKF